MKVIYRTRALQKVCTDFSAASRKYGYRMTELIFKRIEQIQYADDIESLVSARIGRCHALKGNRSGQYHVRQAEHRWILCTPTG